MQKLSTTMIRVLSQFADAKPHSIKNDLFNVRCPTLASLHQRGLIRPERKTPFEQYYLKRYVITPQGKAELDKRGKWTRES